MGLQDISNLTCLNTMTVAVSCLGEETSVTPSKVCLLLYSTIRHSVLCHFITYEYLFFVAYFPRLIARHFGSSYRLSQGTCSLYIDISVYQ